MVEQSLVVGGVSSPVEALIPANALTASEGDATSGQSGEVVVPLVGSDAIGNEPSVSGNGSPAGGAILGGSAEQSSGTRTIGSSPDKTKPAVAAESGVSQKVSGQVAQLGRSIPTPVNAQKAVSEVSASGSTIESSEIPSAAVSVNSSTVNLSALGQRQTLSSGPSLSGAATAQSGVESNGPKPSTNAAELAATPIAKSGEVSNSQLLSKDGFGVRQDFEPEGSVRFSEMSLDAKGQSLSSASGSIPAQGATATQGADHSATAAIAAERKASFTVSVGGKVSEGKVQPLQVVLQRLRRPIR